MCVSAGLPANHSGCCRTCISRRSVVVSNSAEFPLVRVFFVVQMVISGVGLVLHGARPSVLYCGWEAQVGVIGRHQRLGGIGHSDQVAMIVWCRPALQVVTIFSAMHPRSVKRRLSE